MRFCSCYRLTDRLMVRRCAHSEFLCTAHKSTREERIQYQDDFFSQELQQILYKILAYHAPCRLLFVVCDGSYGGGGREVFVAWLFPLAFSSKNPEKT